MMSSNQEPNEIEAAKHFHRSKVHDALSDLSPAWQDCISKLNNAIFDIEEACKLTSAYSTDYIDNLRSKKKDLEEGIGYYRKNDFANARDCFLRVVANYPNHFNAWWHIAQSEYNLKSYDASLKAFIECHRSNPKDPHGKLGSGNNYLERGKWKEALEDLSESIAIKPMHYTYDRRSKVYEAMGDLDNALADAEQVQKMAPMYDVQRLERLKVKKQERLIQRLQQERTASRSSALLHSAKSILFFTSQTVEKSAKLKELLKEVDCSIFNEKALSFVKAECCDEAYKMWACFSSEVRASDFNRAEKLLLLQTAFNTINETIQHGEFAQFLILAEQLKSTFGSRLLQLIMTANVAQHERSIYYYIRTFQLLIDLNGVKGLIKCVRDHLPSLVNIIEQLQILEEKHLTAKCQPRNLEETITRFAEKNAQQSFPLTSSELSIIKVQYDEVIAYLQSIKNLSQQELKALIKTANKQQLIAILTETMRRFYKIKLYDTQILSVLALLNTPEKLKGRIAQIKTGEGKSSIIAMLSAYMGCQGQFVDVITSSSYLAKRDCAKFAKFYSALDLTTSCISHTEQRKEHFEGQILYGTNTDFEFAFLRDNLFHTELRFSTKAGVIQPRTFDAAIVDEADNLFLDTAMSSARMAIPSEENINWIYEHLINFVKDPRNEGEVTKARIIQFRKYLKVQMGDAKCEAIKSLTSRRIAQWLENANDAIYKKKENHHYEVKVDSRSKNNEKNILIRDHANTGRAQEGCRWQHGLHQLLQAKHGLKISSESLTAASISHPTYFNRYTYLLGLTGTMGEVVERAEIQKIYGIDSFDVPPHFPCQREVLPPEVLIDKNAKFERIIKDIEIMQKKGQPILILFKTIKESNEFSDYLANKKIKHQLLNDTQQESEDYLIARAGQSKTITISTNMAGRGTDILLYPESKAAGGLHMIFTFYPDNLRVQDQGFGRAGRQGQLGSCRMILDLEDETIQSLIKSSSTLEAIYFISLCEKLKIFSKLEFTPLHLAARDGHDHIIEKLLAEGIDVNCMDQNGWTPLDQVLHNEKLYGCDYSKAIQLLKQYGAKTRFELAENMPAKRIIDFLNLLRTKKIQLQSQLRQQSAQMETLYYQQLSLFFTHFNEVVKFVEDEQFKNTIIPVCKNQITQNQLVEIMDYDQPEWASIKAQAKLLITNEMHHHQTDWRGFYDQFTETYTRFILTKWAAYYTELQEATDHTDISGATKMIAEYHAEIEPLFKYYLLNPKENITNCLAQILHQCYLECVTTISQNTLKPV